MDNITDKRTGIPIIGGSGGGHNGRHAKIELENFVTPKSVEAAYRWANEQATHSEAAGHILALKGMRAARARDPKMLLALEKGAEIMHQIAEAQVGRTHRDSEGRTAAEKTWPTEAALWREAYVTCDKGTPVESLAWIYAAAARLAGLI